MKLPRPYIPLAVRVEVAERQMLQATGCRVTDAFYVPAHLSKMSLGARLKAALFHLSRFGAHKMHLDHDPPLGAREKVMRCGVIIAYRPAANDPRYLVYRFADEHQIKTNVRGEHGQHPDRVLIKKQRRRERRARPKPKRAWPSRPFPKGRSFA